VINTFHQIIGGAAQRNDIARPLPGGGVLVDHLAHDEEDSDDAPLSSAPSSNGRSFFSFPSKSKTQGPSSAIIIPFQEEVTNPPSAPDEVELEAALQEALKFLQFFTQLDRSGDKFISLDELKTILPDEGKSPPTPTLPLPPTRLRLSLIALW
jgi:hypothetical protein